MQKSFNVRVFGSLCGVGGVVGSAFLCGFVFKVPLSLCIGAAVGAVFGLIREYSYPSGNEKEMILKEVGIGIGGGSIGFLVIANIFQWTAIQVRYSKQAILNTKKLVCVH